MTEVPTRVPSQARDAELAAALAHANIPTLLLVLAQFTGDGKWLNEPYLPLRGAVLDDNDTGGLSDEVQSEIRAAAFDAILANEAGVPSPELTPERIVSLLGAALVDDVSPDYGDLLAEELGVLSRDVDVPQPIPAGLSVLIIGSGVSGLALAVKLKAAGVPFTIIEKNDDIGGTWLENVYPGCGVDTPSHIYSFSFAQNAEWTRFFAKQPEIKAYIDRVVDQHDLRSKVLFSHEVVSASFDTAAAQWRVVVRDSSGHQSTLSAPVLVSGVGNVNRPSIPSIPGAESFAGLAMHTAAWQPDVDLTGKRVAVIGTGASAMQLVPSIAGVAGKVTVFQRSKQWALPHPNYRREIDGGVRYLFQRVPAYLHWYRLRPFWNFGDKLHSALQIDPAWEHPDRSINVQNERHRVFLTRYIKDQLGDRVDLYDACIPDYPPYGKRPLLDNGWFKTIQRPDVDLVTQGISHITEHGVVTTTGEQIEADILVWATGFKALQFLWPMDIYGASGEKLADQWGYQDARAYLGMTVPDFPNMFILNGPNTFAGHGGSAFYPCEFQVRYIMQAIARLANGDIASLEVRKDVYEDYNAELDAALDRCIWSHEGMTNWFRNAAGRQVITSPWTYLDYWNRTKVLKCDEYVETPFEH
ncbi:NAD(P)/FAD-dependent oxidoreductase [Mycolicibacterium sp. CH28]|uniref:flavin-containing monooxygenase n=1 Tax=Mycolicibacterium sp. CH28 TaxID=2512237 RepID=UPI001080AA21|nr:NAD(P)/FAD-dependent oxidoreductase [Mycolicibacterium sp. CH28]TGD90043.1 NAD(P)/FAD-dependent oxidoreductase [Mycolicibacterium sp. CH28]